MILELISVMGAGLYAKKKYQEKRKGKDKSSRKSKKSRLHKSYTSLADTSVRDQQLQQFTADDVHQPSPQQKKNGRNLKIALTSVGFSSIGYLLYPPLAWLSLPGIIYITHFPALQAYQSFKKDKKVTVDLMSASSKTLLTLNGYFFFASFAVFLYSINRILLARISNNSKKNLLDVFKQQPKTVWITCDKEVEKEVAFATLKVGDIVIVSAGNTIPVDGCIVEGMASIDQHILTGESQPSEKEVGEEVFALTLVLSGKIYIKVTRTGEETTASQMASILNNTLGRKTDAQLWASQVSDKTVLPTFALSAASFPLVGPTTALAILNSHFNYRASIASAIGVMSYLDIAARKGILIKDGRTFEILNSVDTVVFDKTGTLTEEQPHVGKIMSCHGLAENDILRYAAAAESKQSHPIAKAILQASNERELVLPSIEEASYQLGYGLVVNVVDTDDMNSESETQPQKNTEKIRIGSLRFLQQEGLVIPDNVEKMQQQCHHQGSPMVAIARDDEVIGAIELQVTVRAGVAELIQSLHKRGVYTCIISGDHEAPTRQLAQQLGIKNYFAETLPEQKATLLEQLQTEGKTICYVGDGVNDAIALKQADIAISLQGASAVATDTAQVVLMDQTLHHLPFLFDMSHEFNHQIKKTVSMVMMPTAISITSAFMFLNIGLLPSFIFPQLGLMMGILTATRPAIEQNDKLDEFKEEAAK